MKIILILLGAGTAMSLLLFVFGMWYLDAAEHSRVILKHRPVVGTILVLLGVAIISFVFVVSNFVTLDTKDRGVNSPLIFVKEAAGYVSFNISNPIKVSFMLTNSSI